MNYKTKCQHSLRGLVHCDQRPAVPDVYIQVGVVCLGQGVNHSKTLPIQARIQDFLKGGGEQVGFQYRDKFRGGGWW